MPNPRRKISRSKRDKRRAPWMGKIAPSQLTTCEHCKEKKLPHHACPSCGYYSGRSVFIPKSA